MFLEGFFSEKKMQNEFIRLSTCLRLGLAYISAKNFVLGNAEVFLYVKNLPKFIDVYEYFMSCRAPLLKLNKQQDMCLSLLYNPFFNEFYTKLKTEIKNLTNNRLSFLKKYLLMDLADPVRNKIIMDYDMPEKAIYINQKMFHKSKELMHLIISRE